MNALATLEPNSLTEAMEFSKILAESELVPVTYRGKPANVLVGIQWGREIGLSAMQALQSIAVINGRPSIWGDAALALVRGSSVCDDVIETLSGAGEAMVARCEARRRGATPVIRTFSVDDARKAGLWSKQGPWQQYPQRMLQQRARGFALRDAFPDILRGIVTIEEARDEPIDITPQQIAETTAAVNEWRDEKDGKPTETTWADVGLDENKLIAQGNIASKHLTLLEMWWKGLTPEQRGVLGAKGRGVGPYLPMWKEGQQVSKASQDDPVKPPAAVDVSAETPQAVGDKEDVFGLQQHPDEAFARTVIAAIEASTTVAELDAARKKWSEGGDWHKRMSEIPEASWQDIMERYRQKEDQLTGRSP